MNKMKEVAATLEKYLGHDKRGIALLENVILEANNIRKALATSQREHQAAVESRDKLRRMLDARDQEIADLKEEVRRAREEARSCRATMATQQSHIDILERALDPPPFEHPTGHKLHNLARFKDIFKGLRKAMPTPPPPVLRRPSGVTYLFDLTDIVDDYRDEKFKLLGMFSVVCCLMGWGVGFTMEERQSFRKLGDTDEREIAKFVHWIGKEWIQPMTDLQNKILDATGTYPSDVAASVPNRGPD